MSGYAPGKLRQYYRAEVVLQKHTNELLSFFCNFPRTMNYETTNATQPIASVCTNFVQLCTFGSTIL